MAKVKSAGITAGDLRRVVTYDPISGVFTRIAAHKCHRDKLGLPTGTKHKRVGYVYISIGRRRYMAHRLAWLYMTGEWPADEVDHKDRNRSNNAWENLRSATRTQNMMNVPVRPNNALGVRGIRWTGNRYEARIRKDGRPIVLGSRSTLEEAQKLYAEASEKAHGEFGRIS
jgi:HNH endonuclease